jgi:hypothetical protein
VECACGVIVFPYKSVDAVRDKSWLCLFFFFFFFFFSFLHFPLFLFNFSDSLYSPWVHER